MREGAASRHRLVMRAILALFYLAAAIVHLRSPDAFLPIVPDWVPSPRLVIVATGFCEVAGSIGLFVPGLIQISGFMLALYAVCVFPANIKHAIDGISVAGLPSSWWYHAPRFALQPVLVWWAFYCVGLIDWPFRPEGRKPH